ncbi:ABC transporter ATP-binding protein [Methylocystis bryophila]|uniref:ABC transporter ATP-binding protein n=1 Tax=Methylocystis bryophila TaxID=655015 RepID=UPI000A26A67D|nr:ABC transporter ATP-binding protein [Methylocystis bryophila]BDV40994.1 ABC transporter ATP-binding protein [Methylocystis bryophila]
MTTTPTDAVCKSAAPAVECRGLSRTYNLGGESVPALRGVSFEIERGEFVAIMGASGSGKSTLLNLLGALDKPTAGEIVIDGESVSAMGDDELAALRSRKIGFVFQQFNLLPRMSALENVLLPLNYSREVGLDKKALALARLAEMGLEARVHHRPSQLSGGQQQRVAIARALVNGPSLVLADEPTGALDTQTSQEIMRLFSELHVKGLTVIVITHEPEVAAYTERVLRFRDGELIDDTRQTPIDANLQGPRT